MVAGNFGDVVKHNILLEVVDLLTKENDSFNYFETHGSHMSQEICSDHSTGIMRVNALIKKNKPTKEHVVLLKAIIEGHYLKYIDFNFTTKLNYPSSWILVHKLLYYKRMKEHTIDVCEIDSTTYSKTISDLRYDYPNIHYHCTDGYTFLENHLSYGLRPSLVLIDPCYDESKDELKRTLSRMESIVDELESKEIPFLIWYPVYKVKFNNIGFPFKNEDNFIEVDNTPNPSTQNLDTSGMIFSNALMNYIPEVKSRINYLNKLGFKWKVK
ncbi:23S rRNA (adenine(2030)-N(6))-methyltransferase RlmJ [Paenibacillus sp. FSL H7-0940]|uniref:23S rRNA (adenine(2030)-N(6))-methyltransferase RlmJ n=1 Tax=Paenibacillus sp. FSL H7-0940 TaxID=2921443 RepID=UPI0030EC7118